MADAGDPSAAPGLPPLLAELKVQHDNLDVRLSAEVQRLQQQLLEEVALLRQQLAEALSVQDSKREELRADFGTEFKEVKKRLNEISGDEMCGGSEADPEEEEEVEYDPETQIFRDALENAMQEEEDPETAIFRDALENALQEDDMHFMARDALEKALEMEEKPDQMDQTQRPAAQVFDACARTVKWSAKGFKRRLLTLVKSKEDPAIRSPGFSLCGLPEMRLELRMASRESNDEATPALPFAPIPMPSSCCIGLWAPLDLGMTFAITLGHGATAITRRFEHVFQQTGVEPMDSEDRVLFTCSNFCTLTQVWSREADTVHASVEILGFRCAPVSTLPPPPPPPEPAQFLTEEEEDEAERERVAKAGESAQPSDEMYIVRDLITETIVQERCMAELRAIRNRSVRRVEWRLEGCGRLLECPVGQAIDSPIFAAAGLERIQLHFYPRDKTATGSANQPCGLFVSGPERTTMRAVLWVGSQQRNLEHRFQQKGDTGGRSRFCALETQIDFHESVLVALDVTEVETDLPEQSATLLLREAHNGPHASPQKAVPAPIQGTKGLLSMKRGDPGKTEEIVKCVSLPTLNARQAMRRTAPPGGKHLR